MTTLTTRTAAITTSTRDESQGADGLYTSVATIITTFEHRFTLGESIRFTGTSKIQRQFWNDKDYVVTRLEVHNGTPYYVLCSGARTIREAIHHADPCFELVTPAEVSA